MRAMLQNRYVDNVHRPQGCLFSCSHPSQVPEVSTLPGTGKSVSVQGSSIWSRHSPKAVYQSSRTTEKDGTVIRHQAPPVHRRLAEQGVVKRRSESQDSKSSKTHRGVRLDSESAQVETVPKTNFGQFLTSPLTTPRLDERYWSHGSNFQAGAPRAPTHETNSTGSGTAVGLEVSSGLFHSNLTSGAGAHPMVDQKRGNFIEGVPLHPPQATVVMYMDVSLEGWATPLPRSKPSI